MDEDKSNSLECFPEAPPCFTTSEHTGVVGRLIRPQRSPPILKPKPKDPYRPKRDELFHAILELTYALAYDYEDLRQQHTAWTSPNPAEEDARVSVLNATRNAIESGLIGTAICDRSPREFLINTYWKYVNVDADGEKIMGIFDAFVRAGVLLFSFSVVESHLRAILRALLKHMDKTGSPKPVPTEYKCAYDMLFNRLFTGKRKERRQQLTELFDFWRELRNAVFHGDGMYISKQGKNDQLRYNGDTYDLIHGQPIAFLGWEFIVGLMTDVRKALLDIIAASALDDIPRINYPLG